MRRLRVGIDSYGLLPLGMEPMDVLRWAVANGAEGVQFSGLEPEVRRWVDRPCLEDIRDYARAHDLYLEWGGAGHIPREMGSWARKEIFECNRKAAEEAAVLETVVVRSCSGGLMRWGDDAPMTETLLRETAEALRAQRSMLRDHGVILSLETHFEFTTHELLRLLEMCEAEPGDWLGICLDTMNLLTMLEDPLRATDRVLPWVTSTHLKDGGLSLTAEGLVSFPCAIGDGVLDLATTVRRLASLPREVALSIEDHGGSFSLPIFDPSFVSRFPDLTAGELARLLRLVQATSEARGAGRCVTTSREAWPSICEDRMRKNVTALRGIVNEAVRDAER
jgi:sugar phosphate isomerase/epimerase